MLYDVLLAPFADFGFMRRALVGSGPTGEGRSIENLRRARAMAAAWAARADACDEPLRLSA